MLSIATTIFLPITINTLLKFVIHLSIDPKCLRLFMYIFSSIHPWF